MAPRNKYGNVRVLYPGIDHGTTAGYWREKNRGLAVCDDCREAWNAACVDYNLRTGRIRRKRIKSDKIRLKGKNTSA